MDMGTLVPLAKKEPVHVNINLSAEYRYTKILSFWVKVNNIAFNKYYEYAYYPTQRFLCMVGFSIACRDMYLPAFRPSLLMHMYLPVNS